MTAIKELRSIAKMSQSKFATYLGIPIANIQHWEKGISTPPNYIAALIYRVMKADGYISDSLNPLESDAIRQTQATLKLEGLSVSDESLKGLKMLVTGQISREDYQKELIRRYKNHEPY